MPGVSERDVDLLLLEEFVAAPTFSDDARGSKLRRSHATSGQSD